MATPTNLPASFVTGAVLTAAQMNDLRGAFRILQVVSANVTDRTFSTASTTYVDVTGLSLSITPQSATSQILLYCSVGGGNTNAGFGVQYFQFVRNSTAVGNGAEASFLFWSPSSDQTGNASNLFIDSPNLTSAITYKIQVKVPSGTFRINRRGATDLYNGNSVLMAMEISA
jgi:hypothetical protein